jgi:hypothetical protein
MSHGLVLNPTRDPDLWIATSDDAGRTFRTPRRLSVSTDASDVIPSLAHGKDGLHRLVWVSDRVDRGRPDLWISTSKDLATWTFPRKVRLPSLGALPGAVNLTTPSLDVAQPRLLDDGRGTLHLFVHLETGPLGSGLYVLTSNDGETWGDASLVASGLSFYGAARRGDADFVVAVRRLQTGVVTLRVSEADGSWRTVEGRRPGAVESYWAPSATALALAGDDAWVWDALAPTRHGLFRGRLGADSGPPVTVVEDEEVEDALALPDGTVVSLLSMSALAWRDGLRVLRTEPPR